MVVTRFQRNTILALHYMGFLIVNYIVTKYPHETWVFIVLTAVWTFFFAWGLNYLNKSCNFRIEIQRNTIVSLHYMALLIIYYLKYHHGTWIYLFSIPLLTLFFAWGLDYLGKRYNSKKSYYFYLAVALLTGGLVAYIVARIMDTVAARKERREIERHFQENLDIL